MEEGYPIVRTICPVRSAAVTCWVAWLAAGQPGQRQPARRIAGEVDVAVLAINYRLAPEHPTHGQSDTSRYTAARLLLWSH